MVQTRPPVRHLLHARRNLDNDRLAGDSRRLERACRTKLECAAIDVPGRFHRGRESEYEICLYVYTNACSMMERLTESRTGMQGVVIAWWVRARRGSTLTKLHHDWRSGTTLRGALTAGRHMGLLGLACILSTLVVIDGPLLQRSSTVREGPVASDPIPLNVTMAQELPTGWSGTWLTATENAFNQHWPPIYNATLPLGDREVSNDVWPGTRAKTEAHLGSLYFADQHMAGVFTGCAGKRCRAVLRAPAMTPVSCTTNELDVNYTQETGPLDLMITGGETEPLRSQLFFIANGLIPEGKESMAIVTAFSQSTDCAGILSVTACEFVSAIGDYNVTIENNEATLDSPGHPTIVALANNTAVNEPSAPWKRVENQHSPAS